MDEDIKFPTNLIGEYKNKPFIIKITCVDAKQLDQLAADVRFLIESKYISADFSVSGGEL